MCVPLPLQPPIFPSCLLSLFSFTFSLVLQVLLLLFLGLRRSSLSLFYSLLHLLHLYHLSSLPPSLKSSLLHSNKDTDHKFWTPRSFISLILIILLLHTHLKSTPPHTPTLHSISPIHSSSPANTLVIPFTLHTHSLSHSFTHSPSHSPSHSLTLPLTLPLLFSLAQSFFNTSPPHLYSSQVQVVKIFPFLIPRNVFTCILSNIPQHSHLHHKHQKLITSIIISSSPSYSATPHTSSPPPAPHSPPPPPPPPFPPASSEPNEGYLKIRLNMR